MHLSFAPIAWLVFTTLLPVPTHAAADLAAEAGSLEEIVVTASRNAQRIFDSTASLSVITDQELERAVLPTLAELLRDVPGLQVTDSGQPGLGRVRIRGEESRRTAILVNSQEVTDHYEVGTPLALHPAMVERIEVMRGSGAVLYGSRALSGVVNFLTRKGGSEPVQATLSAEYDSATDGYNAFASVYGNVQGFEYRLAWSESDYQERATPVGTMENTAFESENQYLYAGKGFADHRLEYIYENFESSSDIYVEEEVRTTFPLTDFYLETPQRDRNKHGLFYRWDADSGWLQGITANAFYQQSERHFYTHTETVWYRRDINNYSELDTSGALAQLDFQPLGNHRLLAGIQYLYDEVDQTRHVDTLSWVPSIASSGIEVIEDRANIETGAWFAQDQWQVTGDLTLTAGLRQYFVSSELEYSDRDSLTPGKLDDDSELIGSLGAVWGISDSIRLRANIAQGYVYPSLMQLATGAYAGSRFVNPSPDLVPETSVNYELGMRIQSNGFSADLTAFYTESEDYIHHQPCAPQDNCPSIRDRLYLNIGESQAQGIELYLGYNENGPGLSPYANLTWMERNIDYPEFSTWHSGIPALSGRLGLRWQGAVRSLPNLWSDFYLRGESSSDLEEPGTVRNVLDGKAGWVTVNLSTGVDFGHKGQYQLALELRNLTDKAYIASGENLYGAERSMAMKMSLNF